MTTPKQSSPLFAWLEAGAALVAEQVGLVNKQVDAQIDEAKATSQRTLDELSQRGQEVEDNVKAFCDPSILWDKVWNNPLMGLVPDFTMPAKKRDAQLQALSVKVDVLVEQVALLAAKQAAEKQAQAQKATAKKPSPRRKTAEPTTTKRAATTTKTPTKPAAKTSSSKRTSAAKKDTPSSNTDN